ncbi:MAG: ferrous iron transport protein B [Selenomonadaceae bacterium]|nr:ferrous iron transport protein B [Selenomonadaceae bacterium]
MSDISIALTGNPNTGKSTIFNQLTGARQKIGNWPGVTVDKKIGYLNYQGRNITVVDLPGTYSVSARSPEEAIVMDFLKNNKMDVVVDVLDSSNLERNLFLTLQLMEEGIPLLIDLNMQDEAKKRGLVVNKEKLSQILGMPVVETVGRRSDGVKTLLSVFTTEVMEKYHPSEMIQSHIENVKSINESGKSAEEIEEAIIDARYALINNIVSEVVTIDKRSVSVSETIDKYLANGILAPFLFLGIMYVVFLITFEWIGQPIADLVDELVAGPITEGATSFLEGVGVSEWLKAMIVDGAIAGVGAVLTFVPLIFILFFCLSFLDGTGYMARVAFVTDPVMRRVGLTGKGIMPMMMSFGCAVPAIMGARALDSEKDRLTAIMVTPFLTCGAKLPIMALFAAMFFPDNAANVVFLMYIIGVVMAIVAAKILGATVLKDEGSTFLLELPPYRIPDIKTVLLETWDKGKGYLIKAGTIIFAASVIVWFLANFNFSGQTEEMSESFLAGLGGIIAPLFYFHGFNTWEAGAAVINGILAKETVVSTMGILYGVAGEIDPDTAAEEAEIFLNSGMGAAFTSLSAFTFMVFSQLYTPCVTALGTIKKEAGGFKWMAFSAVYMFFLAWVVSLLVYQIGRLLGF